MKDTKKPVSFVINPEGYIALDNFKPRTLYEALYVFLEEDWDTSREAFSHSMIRSADLLSMVLIIRNDFERGLMQETDRATKELKQATGGHAPIETSAKKGNVGPDAETEKLLCLFTELMTARALSIKAWVEQLSDDKFSALITTLKNYLDTSVTHFHDAFSTSRDSATGAAVHIMRGLSPIDQEELKLEYLSDVEPYDQSPELMKVFSLIHTPDFVTTKLTVAQANKVAKEIGLPIVFRKKDEPKKKAKQKKSRK